MTSHSLPRFEVILFDLGSTLIYFDAQWSHVIHKGYAALLQSLLHAGLSLEEEEFLHLFDQRLGQYYAERDTEFIEYTTANILKSLLAELGYKNLHTGIIRAALEAMYAVSQAYWIPEEDTLPTLEALHQSGYRMGLISNAADDTDVQTLVDKAGIRGFFDVILTSAAQGIRKPNPRIFHQALEHWGITPTRAAMVGDTLGADILGAKNAGIYSIWITRRAYTSANQAHQDTIKPQAVVNALSELPGLLARLQVGE